MRRDLSSPDGRLSRERGTPVEEELLLPTTKRGIRQHRILDHLTTTGQASAAELAELTGVSVMTVHRDIEELKSRGMIRKFHGGVSMLPSSAFESTAEFRHGRNVHAKLALARVARTFVEPGSSVMLDDSTTAFALAQELLTLGPFTLVSNYRQVAELFRTHDEVEFFLIGGHYSAAHDSYISPSTLSGLDHYAVDVCFQSSSTMDAERTYHQEQNTTEMKKTMLLCGTRRVLMMDGSKVGKTSLHRFAELSEFTDVIVTNDAPDSILGRVSELTNLHIAEL